MDKAATAAIQPPSLHLAGHQFAGFGEYVFQAALSPDGDQGWVLTNQHPAHSIVPPLDFVDHLLLQEQRRVEIDESQQIDLQRHRGLCAGSPDCGIRGHVRQPFVGSFAGTCWEKLSANASRYPLPAKSEQYD